MGFSAFWKWLPVLALLFQASCAAPATPEALVDLRFREFYDIQGGQEVLGLPIAPMTNANDKQYQLTENVVMVYDPHAPPGEQFNFEPVGLRLVTQTGADAPLPIPPTDGQRIINGHVIFDEFAPLFDRLGGTRFAGHPLTEVRRNQALGRYEQLFEKVGFYRNFVDSPHQVRLLPYGLLACHTLQSADCGEQREDATLTNALSEPFLPIILRLGEGFAGKPLSAVYLAADNRLEQVYENVVVSADPGDLYKITLRPLPQLVGAPIHTPTTQRMEDSLSFYPVGDGSLGYNVAKAFLEYVVLHGGVEFSGAPVSEIFDANGMRRQCFTNYCLDFDPLAPQPMRIKPAPLGYEYLRQQGYTQPKLQIRVWDEFPVLAPGQTQSIGVMVYNETPNQPVSKVQPILRIRQVNGETLEARLPPTQANGTTYFSTPGGDEAGSAFYEVCVEWPGSEAVCARESWFVK